MQLHETRGGSPGYHLPMTSLRENLDEHLLATLHARAQPKETQIKYEWRPHS